MMDTPEKRVLRRKKQNICSNFSLTDEYIDVFKKRGLITGEVATILKRDGNPRAVFFAIVLIGAWEIQQGESTNAKRVERFIEWLPADLSAFKLFCSIIADPGSLDLQRYVWLADELRAELKYEKDELVVDEHVEKECSILVFREFGSSKRLSKPELKQLERLVSRRTQCAREIWRTPLMKAINDVSKERDLNLERDQYLRKINEKTDNFVRIHKTRLKNNNNFKSKKTSTQTNGISELNADIVETNNNDVPEKKGRGLEKLSGRLLMEILEGHLNSLLELTAQALLERDGLAEEKTRALRILDLPEIPNTKLDLKLREAMQAAERQLTDAEEKLRSKESHASSLEEQLRILRRDTEHDIETKEKRIQELQQSLKNSRDLFADMELSLEKLGVNFQPMRVEMKANKQRGYIVASRDKVAELQSAAAGLEREVQSVKAELKKYKQRAEMLERNRRIGYIEKPKTEGSFEKSASPSTRLPTINNSATSRTSSRGTMARHLSANGSVKR